MLTPPSPGLVLVKGKARPALELKVVLGELSVAGGSFQEGRCPLEVWKYSVQTPCTQVCVSLAFGMPVLS